MAAPTVTVRKRRKTPGDAPARYHLVVVGRDGARPFALPLVGQVTIGRGEDADVRLADPRASRYHARITVGDVMEVEDLGSRNGTILRDQSLAPGHSAPFRLGDAIAIGSTVMVLHGGEPELEERRVWTHGYLETRLVEECARAQSRASELGLARIHVQGQAPAILVEQILGDALRDGDLLAAYAVGEYEALLLDCAEATSRALTETLVAALGAQQIAATSGLALFPADGTSPQALVGLASERVRQAGDGSRGSGAAGPGVVVESQAMRSLNALARRASAGTSNVLIVGETGVGKEVLAETVHRSSPRADKVFLALNCAAFSESLVESELFGFERGAFTGAHQAKTGLLEAASGGTLFLDEVGEMPLGVQAKLLRVIETRQVLRIGATKPRAIDVRLVAATNRDLEEEVAEKRFREDLYFRLNVISLEIPPLRERREEIDGLARLFLDKLAQPLGRSAPTLSDEALALLRAYAWPGNIRELRNVIERAFVLCAGRVVTAEHLPVERMSRKQRVDTDPPTAVATSDPAAVAAPPPGTPGLRSLKEVERDAIADALQRCHGNQTRAAELLGMPRRTLCKRMKEYELPRPRA
jgi:two-component system, NtrC family, response regulator AtoC